MSYFDQENPQAFIKKQMMDKANDQIQQTLANMRSEVERMTHEQNQDKAREEESPKFSGFEKTSVETKPEQPHLAPQAPSKFRPLIYFSYPVVNFQEIPQWVAPLREALCSLGYLVYSPGELVGSQFGKPDLPFINALEKKATKGLCSVLSLPEELLLPYENIARFILSGDQGEPYYSLFKHLWFLVRANLIVADLTRPSFGGETGQELLYAKQLGIPTLGVLPENGSISPWLHRSLTALLTAEFNLSNMIPLVRGYAPC